MVICVLVAAAYVLAAKLGLSLAYSTAQITAVWPPSGIALVAIFILGYRYSPAIFVGAFVANVLTREPALVAGGLAVGNTMEALVATLILKKWVGFKGKFTKPKMVLGFGAACAASTVVAAAIGTTCLALGGLVAWRHFGTNWTVYWAGDLLGDLIFATFLFICLDRKSYRPLQRRYPEAGFLLLGTLIASTIAFSTGSTVFGLRFYLILPFMIWAAWRFTKLGVATSSVIIALVAVWAAVNGLGGASQLPPDQLLLALLVFVIVMSETMMLLAVAVDQRVSAEAALLRQTNELEKVQVQLREANRRVTGILESVLDEDRPKR